MNENETKKHRTPLVEKTADWRRLKNGERDAGLLAPVMNQLMIALFHCDLCKIVIGPGYHEQLLYFYFVYDQFVCLGDTLTYFFAGWLKVCGGCAHHLVRQGSMIPERLCALRPEHWLTTTLLCQPGEQPQPANLQDGRLMSRIRRAINEHITCWYHYLLTLLLFFFHIPIAWFIPSPPLAERVVAHTYTPTSKPALLEKIRKLTLVEEDILHFIPPLPSLAGAIPVYH